MTCERQEAESLFISNYCLRENHYYYYIRHVLPQKGPLSRRVFPKKAKLNICDGQVTLIEWVTLSVVDTFLVLIFP